jgi:hypothetical protein
LRDEPIMICATCGVGFLRNPGSKVHPTPVWFVGFEKGGPTSGGTCGGEIRMRDRRTQIHYLDLTEAENDQNDPGS